MPSTVSLPENRCVIVQDPHKGGCVLWTFFHGKFYQRTVTAFKWTRVRRIHLTPARVFMLHELLISTVENTTQNRDTKKNLSELAVRSYSED